MLVQSFGGAADAQSREDFHRFADFLGLRIAEGQLGLVLKATEIPLYVGWVNSEQATEAKLAAAIYQVE
jgi:hypothetical protein